MRHSRPCERPFTGSLLVLLNLFIQALNPSYMSADGTHEALAGDAIDALAMAAATGTLIGRGRRLAL
jgi:hypothetical protein